MKYNPLSRDAASPFSLRAARSGKGDDALTAGRPLLGIPLLGRGVVGSAYAVGTVVTCSVIGTGVILSAAGEAIAFVPNAIGRALLHNERL